MLFIAELAADNRISSSIGSIDSRLGRMMTRTPTKPITTAAQRRNRTSSCKMNAAANVANKGAVKLTAAPRRFLGVFGAYQVFTILIATLPVQTACGAGGTAKARGFNDIG